MKRFIFTHKTNGQQIETICFLLSEAIEYLQSNGYYYGDFNCGSYPYEAHPSLNDIQPVPNTPEIAHLQKVNEIQKL